MHIVLVNPRAQKAHRRLPLSILFLARTIPERHTWEIIDANIDPLAKANAEAAVAREPRDTILMVTVMPGPQLRWAGPWCRELKARYPELTIVWGGYFPTVYTEAVCRDRGVDWVVTGQGEETVPALIEALDSGESPMGMDGVAGWNGAQLQQGSRRPFRRSCDFPLPPYERLPMEKYAAKTFLGNRTYNHHSSVGCPYVCNFCAVTNMFEGRWLADPADRVVEVVRLLHERWGADAIEFHDNNFFAAEKRCAQVADGIADLGLRWWGEGRIDTMLGWSTDTWKRLSRSGLSMVFYGAESGDQAALDAMDKGGLCVDDTVALNQVAMRHGIIPEFSFVLGGPEDPEGDIERSLALVERLKKQNPACEIILYMYTPVPLPGMYEEAKAQGFDFPSDLDGWLSPEWEQYESRRKPVTPWLTPQMVRRVYDFETVLHARWPSVSDRNLKRWQRTVLKALGAPRYRAGFTRHPYAIRTLQRLWNYRRPEEMGF